jgi:hydroxylaminobenzene mutase
MIISHERKLVIIWNGMFLFLVGLLVGLVELQFNNPRMGLAAHLEGLMNGTFLIALGAVWTHVQLSRQLETVAFWAVLYGAYANVITTTLAAIVGANSLSPITGAGHSASPWQEFLVTAGFVSVGIAMVGSSLLLLWGLWPAKNRRRPIPPV